jgi:hypothetical protein
MAGNTEILLITLLYAIHRIFQQLPERLGNDKGEFKISFFATEQFFMLNQRKTRGIVFHEAIVLQGVLTSILILTQDGGGAYEKSI